MGCVGFGAVRQKPWHKKVDANRMPDPDRTRHGQVPCVGTPTE